MNSIQNNSEVDLHFSLRLADTGDVVDSNFDMDPVTFVVGDGNLPPSFESALMGLVAGSKVKKVIKPDLAFGLKNPSNVHKLERNQFASLSKLNIGLIVSFEDLRKNELSGTIVDISDSYVTVDFNHPLAGCSIEFEAEIISVRFEGI